MANIFDKDTGNTDNHLLNEQFHAFSKSPSSPGSTLGGASNRSGHTVSASDVWAEKIPAFFYPKADSDYAVCKANAKLNDICRWGDEIQIWDGEKFVKFADNYAAIPDGHVFLNEDGQPVVRFHKNRVAYNLNDTNNAYDNSLDASGKGAAAKILGWDKTANNGAGGVYAYVESAPQFITQFVAPTDNIVKGVPSKGYGPIVMVGGSPLTEDADSTAGYIANNFAGIIQFNERKAQGDVTVHAFEYCGKTLATAASDIKTHTDEISEIKEKLGLGGGDDNTPTLSSRISATEDTLKILTGTTTGTATESIATTASNAAKAAVDGVNVTSTGSNGITASQTKSVISLEVTPATVAADGTITENADNVVTATGAKSIADKAAADAITAALADTEGSAITEKIESEIADATLEGKIADSTESTKLVTAEQVVTYVEENAKVTLHKAENSGITIDKDGQASTEFTIGIDTDVIATKASVDGVDGRVSAIETSLASGDIHKEIDAVRTTANAAKATADSAVQSVTRATGSSELITVTDGTDVTISLSTEVATKSDITTEIGKLTAEGGSVKTLQTEVAEIKTSLATGGATANAIKAAQDTADQAVADAAKAQGAADKAQGDATQALADAAAAQTQANKGVADAATAQAAAEAAQADATQALADAATAQAAAEAAQADADALEERMDAAESSITATTTIITDLKKVSLTKDSGDGLVKVSTVGTIGDGLQSISVEVSDTIVETTDEFDVTSTGSSNVEVKLTGTVANPSITVKGTDIASAADLTALTTKVDTHIASAAKLSIIVASADSEGRPVVETPETNKLYLVAGQGAESGTYVEWIYLEGGTWERIGTTATDLSEYAKTATVTPLIEAAQTQANKGVADAATAKSAADKAQKAADDAQADVDALEKLVGTTSVGSQIDTKLSTLTDTKAQGGAGVTLIQTNGKVALTVVSGVVDKTGESGADKFVKGETVYAAIATQATKDAAAYAVKGTETVAQNAADAAATAQETAEAKVESITTSDARITLTPTTTDKVKSVAITLASTVATTTDGTAYSKSETEALVKTASDAAKAADDKAVAAQDAADAAQETADAKIAAVEVTTDATTHLGAHHISATTDADKKVTVAVSCSDEWQYTGAALTTVTTVINGKMSDGKTIDDANLTSAEGMFAGNESLTTFVGDLGKLTNGKNMFSGCTGLTTFCGNLSSLTDGTGMFAECALDEESLIYIVDSLPETSGKTITVGVAASVTNKAIYATEALTKGWKLA